MDHSAYGVWKRATYRVWVLFLVLGLVGAALSYGAQGQDGLLAWAVAFILSAFVQVNAMLMNRRLLTRPQTPLALSLFSFALNVIVVMAGILYAQLYAQANQMVMGINLIVLVAVPGYVKGYFLSKRSAYGPRGQGESESL